MKLEELSLGHEAAFLSMTEDYAANDPAGFKRLYARKVAWSTLEFRRFFKELEKQRLDWKPGPNRVSLTRYVMRNEKGEIAGNGLLRFPLNDITETDGGNLFCDVPPSQRRQGHGAFCLSLMLFEAVRAGLRRALVTAPAEDLIARKVIELNRGELLDITPSLDPENKGVKIARYWINFR
jgi:predicted acetyltransferase